jgi:hypothetical protein
MKLPCESRTRRIVLFIMAETALFFAAAFVTTLVAPRPASTPHVPAVFYPAGQLPVITGFWKGREIRWTASPSENPQHNTDRK